MEHATRVDCIINAEEARARAPYGRDERNNYSCNGGGLIACEAKDRIAEVVYRSDVIIRVGMNLNGASLGYTVQSCARAVAVYTCVGCGDGIFTDVVGKIKCVFLRYFLR